MKKRLAHLILVLAGLATGLLLLLSRGFAWPADPDTGAPHLPLPTPDRAIAPDIQITVDEIVASGFENPVQIIHSGDGSGRLFVVEQTGRVKVVKAGTVLPSPFLDLSNLITCCGERGLLGLAFHPNYAENGYLYVNYSRASDGATMIVRYQVSEGDPDRADPDSAITVLTVSQPYGNHNGGQLLFSPRDHYLYIGMGDGGSGGDPLDHAQNIQTLLGAMLRLDVDGGTPYAVPPDNPYVGRDGRDEIWAIGLRNPWRFSFDRDNGDLYIGDVGQNEWEEIDYQAESTPGGVNFGWRCMEGTHEYNFSGDCSSAELTGPIAEYSHEEGRSVTGGFVYRGTLFPALDGRYFYADYVSGIIWSTVKISSEPDTWSAPELELDTGLNISAFGEDEQGELYLVDRTGGTVRRVADVNGPSANLSTSTKWASSASVGPGEVVSYTLRLINTGGQVDGTAHLTDTIPAGLVYVPNSLWASQGSWDDSAQPTLTWQGGINTAGSITVSYQVTATGEVSGSIVNQAILSAGSIAPLTLAASVSVPRSVLSTTMEDFSLPGSQPGDLHDPIAPSIDCDTCHSEPIYDRWRGTMMSQAGRDPLMWAALAVANVDAPDAGDYCLRCHTAPGWLEGRSHPADGSALAPEDLANGVACELCHRLVDPIPSADDEATAIDLIIRENLAFPVPAGYVGSATAIVDPADNRRGPFSFGLALPFHTAYQTDYLGQHGDPVTRSRLCGTCHNVDNPALSWDSERGEYWPNTTGIAPPDLDQLFPIERTYDEWLYSAYAAGGVYAPQFAGAQSDGIVETCQDCHLPRLVGTAADDPFNPVPRDCQSSGCLPEHAMVGGNSWMPELLQDPDWRLAAVGDGPHLDQTSAAARVMLQHAATVSVTLRNEGEAKIATVRVTNQAGHKFPTGYPEGRQAWINLKAYDSAGILVYESGAYNLSVGQLVRDADIKVYEAKQGITEDLAALLNKPAGPSFHFVLNNTVIKDNRIPPRGFQNAHWDQDGLRPVNASYTDGQYWDDTLYTLPIETERVFVILYYQTASREYVEFLEANGGIDGLRLRELWEKLKSPPEIVAMAWFPDYPVYLPLIMKHSP
jgi:uncharacterized repeat protein (TIGR01451 family)